MGLWGTFLVDNFLIKQNVCNGVAKPVVDTLDHCISYIVVVSRNEKCGETLNVCQFAKSKKNINMFFETGVHSMPNLVVEMA